MDGPLHGNRLRIYAEKINQINIRFRIYNITEDNATLKVLGVYLPTHIR